MQNRFLDAVDVETLRHYLNLATKLSSSLTTDDKRELLKLAQDPSLPNKHAQNENAEYARAYTEYHDTLRRGSLVSAYEHEQHIAKIYYAALALSLLPKKVYDQLMANVIFDRTQFELNLFDNELGNDHIIHLCHVLPLTVITNLDVRLNEISDAGAIALAANQTITHLIARYNHIGPTGGQALATNKTMIHLDLTGNYIGDEGTKALADNQTLIQLNVRFNLIDADGAKALAANQTLINLDISDNRIGDEGAKALAANQTLIDLDISDNRIGDEGKKALAEDSPVARYNTGKSVDVNTSFPSLARQAMFAVKTNAKTRLPSGKTLQEEADEKLPEEIKEVLKKPKV